jgi:hypothetical protein
MLDVKKTKQIFEMFRKEMLWKILREKDQIKQTLDEKYTIQLSSEEMNRQNKEITKKIK